MSMYGANPEQLATLGRTLTNQIEAIDQLMSTVDGVLERHRVDGTGPRPLRVRTGTARSSRPSTVSTRRSRRPGTTASPAPTSSCRVMGV